MDGLLLDTENLYTEVNMWFCFTWWIIYDNDCDNCNDDSDDIIENMTVIMAQMIKIFSSGNPKSSVRVWPHLWLGFQGNPDYDDDDGDDHDDHDDDDDDDNQN